MKLLLVAASAALLACGSAEASVVNLLANGSFETGDFNAWNYVLTGGTDVPAIVYYNPSVTAGEPTGGLSPDLPGDYIAVYRGNPDNELIQQHVYLLPGNYTLGFSAYPYSYQNPANEKFTAYLGSTAVASINSATVAPEQWYLVSGNVTVDTAGWYWVKFRYKVSGDVGRDLLIDRVYLVVTPQ